MKTRSVVQQLQPCTPLCGFGLQLWGFLQPFCVAYASFLPGSGRGSIAVTLAFRVAQWVALQGGQLLLWLEAVPRVSHSVVGVLPCSLLRVGDTRMHVLPAAAPFQPYIMNQALQALLAWVHRHSLLQQVLGVGLLESAARPASRLPLFDVYRPSARALPDTAHC